MDKWNREVIQHQLHSEKAVMRDIRRQYEHALRDIDDKIKILMADATPSRAYQAAYQRTLKKQVEDIIDGLFFAEYDAIDKYLNASYTDGYVGAMYAMSGKGVHVIAPIDLNASHKAIVTDSELSEKLYTALNRDMGTLKKVIREDITRGIATSSSYDQIARSVADKASIPLSNANRIVRTEGHRIQQASADDARNAAKAAGADVVKQWDASLDGATRKVHRELDGQIREVGEPFEDRSGKWKAMYPGKFGKPEMDCNCRCVALTRARWALDEDELKVLEERAEFFGIDKTEDFADYRKKFLKATETVENTGKSGIIKLKRNPVKEAVSSGAVSKTVNREKQNRHIKDGAGYIAGRSYIFGTLEDAQRLVDELSGTGEPVMDRKGNWVNKERVESKQPIGVHVDPSSGKTTQTNKGMIVYSSTGSHIYTRRGDEK